MVSPNGNGSRQFGSTLVDNCNDNHFHYVEKLKDHSITRANDCQGLDEKKLANLTTHDFTQFMNETGAYSSQIERMQTNRRELLYLI